MSQTVVTDGCIGSVREDGGVGSANDRVLVSRVGGFYGSVAAYYGAVGEYYAAVRNGNGIRYGGVPGVDAEGKGEDVVPLPDWLCLTRVVGSLLEAESSVARAVVGVSCDGENCCGQVVGGRLCLEGGRGVFLSGEECSLDGVASRGCIGSVARARSAVVPDQSGACTSSEGVQGIGIGSLGEKEEVSGLGGVLSTSGALGCKVVDASGDKGCNVVKKPTPGAFGKVVSLDQVRGPNWERNRRAKEEKRKKKDRRRERVEKLASGSWRSKEVIAEVKVGNQETRRGYFSELNEDTQRQLRESRARMMIAENKRKEREADEKLQYLESPLALVARAMKIVRVAEQCAVKQGDNHIAGWARTVADDYAISVAKSAPSSVPSLDSVKSTVSVSSDDRKAERLAEYKAKKKALLESFEEMDVFSPAHQVATLEALDDDYEDVVLTFEERVKKDMLTPLAEAMHQVAGLGGAKIHQVLAHCGMVKPGAMTYY